MTERSRDGIEHVVQFLAHVFSQKTQHQIAVLLQQLIFAPVAAVRDRIRQMLRMKTKQRRSFSAEMKARMTLEAIKGQRTIQEIASHYGVHPNQVTTWKRQAVEGLSQVFTDRRSAGAESDEALKAELYRQIGQLQVELDWIKKQSGLSR